MSEAPAPYLKGEAQTYRSWFGRRGRTMTPRGSFISAHQKRDTGTGSNCPALSIKTDQGCKADRSQCAGQIPRCLRPATIVRSPTVKPNSVSSNERNSLFSKQVRTIEVLGLLGDSPSVPASLHAWNSPLSIICPSVLLSRYRRERTSVRVSRNGRAERC